MLLKKHKKLELELMPMKNSLLISMLPMKKKLLL